VEELNAAGLQTPEIRRVMNDYEAQFREASPEDWPYVAHLITTREKRFGRENTSKALEELLGDPACRF
jgi:hypothetical protein